MIVCLSRNEEGKQKGPAVPGLFRARVRQAAKTALFAAGDSAGSAKNRQETIFSNVLER
jgi:hypothetical protein